MKKLLFVLYAWSTTILFTIGLLWIASVPNLLDGADEVSTEILKIIYRFVLYSILFILIYRSLIFTFKSSVSRLAKWRSKKEMIEDAEFVLIIETLLVIIAVLVATLVAIFQEYLQYSIQVDNSNTEVKDILISMMSIILTAIIVYSSPVLGEVEVFIKEKTLNLFRKFKRN